MPRRRMRPWRHRRRWVGPPPFPMAAAHQLVAPLPRPPARRDHHLSRPSFVMPRRDQHPLLALHVLVAIPVTGRPPAIFLRNPNGLGDDLVHRLAPDALPN